MGNRAFLRTACAAAALACIAGAAWFALDWADYGSDSTCGNFIRYKGAGGHCAQVMHGRIAGAVGLVAIAIALTIVAAIRPPNHGLHAR